MQRIHTTKTEQTLFSIIVATCCLLVIAAAVTLISPPDTSVQLAHATTAVTAVATSAS